MLYIAKFHARLARATSKTVLAVERGDVATASSSAQEMTREVLDLAQEAAQKASGVFIQANAQIYVSLSQMAQAYADAGLALMGAVNADGTISQHRYQDGTRKLAYAVSQLSS